MNSLGSTINVTTVFLKIIPNSLTSSRLYNDAKIELLAYQLSQVIAEVVKAIRAWRTLEQHGSYCSSNNRYKEITLSIFPLLNRLNKNKSSV